MNTRRLAHVLLACLLFGLTGSALRAGGVWVINEVLADPGAVNDANGDGNFDPVDDEYIEIVNLSGEDQDISLWTISDFVRVRHQFPEGTIVPNECAVVVFGSGPIGRPFTGATFQIASDGSLGLNNSGDTITFADDVGEVLATFQYGNDVGINPNDDAMVRDPDLTGEFVAHSTATNSGGDRISPGRMTGDDPFPGCPDEPPDPGDTGWVVNEFHSMPEPGVGDANLDGTVDDADEFVEIVNATGVEQDISGWVLADGTEGRHQFLPGTLVAHNCSIVVFGGSAEGLPFNGASVQAASSGGLDLDDGGDTIGLVNTNGDTLARLAYGPEGGTVGSRTRDPDVDGEFVDHAESRDDAFSPGTFSDGTRFRGCPDEPVEPDSIEIWEIQGSGDSSPLEGQTVLTAQNIVTAAIRHTRNANGFFLQTPEERSDDDDETSDGIFVYTASNDPPVEVGDIVDVVGDVQEFFDWTEMTNPRVTVRNSGSPLPDPIVLDETRPSPDQPQSPNELERYENMLVEFHDGTVTSTSDAFGNFLAVATPARAFREPGIRYPGEGAVPVWDGNPEVFEVDPDALDGDNVSPAAGAGITECHGPLTWRFGRYRVYPKVLTLDDEFENAASLDDWYLRYLEEGDVPHHDQIGIGVSTEGRLTIDPNDYNNPALSDGGQGPGWYRERKGPYVYKNVTGNFAVMTYVHVGTVADINQVPGGSFNAAGFVMRDPSSYDPQNPGAFGNEAWLMYNVGNQAGYVATETKTTFKTPNGSASGSSLFLTPVPSTHGRLLACRIGDEFRFFRSMEGEGGGWTEDIQDAANIMNNSANLPGIDLHAEGFIRPDFPETMQVGVMVNRWTDNGPSPVRAEFDYVRFAAPESFEDCLASFTAAE